MIFFLSLIQRHPKWGRWLYAAVSSLGAAGFTSAFVHVLSSSNHPGNDRSYEMVIAVAAGAFVAGLICWPRKKRGIGRMIVAGLATVALSFLFIGLMMSALETTRGEVAINKIPEIISMSFLMLLMGSIFTLGIPYIIGICLSFLFIDVDAATEEQSN